MARREVDEFSWSARVAITYESRPAPSSVLLDALRSYKPDGGLGHGLEGIAFVFDVTGESETVAKRWARMLVACVLFDVGLSAMDVTIQDPVVQRR